jgi:hypothetical protein
MGPSSPTFAGEMVRGTRVKGMADWSLSWALVGLLLLQLLLMMGMLVVQWLTEIDSMPFNCIVCKDWNICGERARE